MEHQAPSRRVPDGGVRVAVVGLGFGGSFVPIYIHHPDVSFVGIFDPRADVMAQFADVYPVDRSYRSLEEVLNDPELDAVHLVTPIPDHADQTVAVLEAGKHCACTVPMATSLDDIERIVSAVDRTGLNYMAMETSLYTRHFLHVRRMLADGDLGRVQFLRGAHYQDMTGWPDYWSGLPPMWYATHAISPLVALSGSRVSTVIGLGSGSMAGERTRAYGNPFPVETALLKFENGLAAEVTRSLFETARTYLEGLDVLGSRGSFEWGFADDDAPYFTRLEEIDRTRLNPFTDAPRGRATPVETVDLPDMTDLLPEGIRRFGRSAAAFDPTNPHLTHADGGGGHHGSHPHLVHEFVRSIVEQRTPAVDVLLAANVTATGVLAHESALGGGTPLNVPLFQPTTALRHPAETSQ